MIPTALSIQFSDGGVMMYPITLCGLLVVALALWTATRLWGHRRDLGPRTRAGIDSVLFWGGFSLLLGILGTLIGVMVAARSVEAAGEVPTALVWAGIKVAMVTTVFGMLVLALAALLWFALRLRYRSLVAASA